MSFADSVTIAVQHVQDWDVPQEMLPLTIRNEACILAGLASGLWDVDTILELARMPAPPVYGYAGRTLLETAQSANAPLARLIRAAESL